MARKGKPKWYPRKNWSELKPATRKRYERHGINAKTYYTKTGQAKLKVARGHGTTPERPERAMKNPERFPDYVQRKQVQELREPGRLRRETQERHRRLFGNRVKYRFRPVESDNPSTFVSFLTSDDTKAEEIASLVGSAKRQELKTVVIDGTEYEVVDWEWMLYH